MLPRSVVTRAGAFASAVLITVVCLALGAEPAAAQSGAASESTPRHADEVEGSRLVDTGKPKDGLPVLERAVAAYRRSGNRLGIARVRLKMSAACRTLAQ